MPSIHISIENSDPELNRKSLILQKIIWSVIGILTLAFGINMFVQPENLLRYAVILLLVWSVSAGLLWALKKGHVYFSSLVYVSFLLLMIFAFSWTGGGIKGHGIKILPVVVLFAGLTMGKKEIWIFGGVATFGGLLLAVADYFQQLPVTEPLGQSSWVFWIYSTTAIFLLCFLENLSVGELRKALARTQEELIMRRKSEQLLAEKNKKLIEIALLQSHQVRRPVASVLGLVSLLKPNEPHDPINAEVLSKIKTATQELDAVIREIVHQTAEMESQFALQNENHS